MEHIFREGQNGAPTLILLHGTGGDEFDLLPLGEALNENYHLLSIQRTSFRKWDEPLFQTSW